jgi:hypothetical protein
LAFKPSVDVYDSSGHYIGSDPDHIRMNYCATSISAIISDQYVTSAAAGPGPAHRSTPIEPLSMLPQISTQCRNKTSPWPI